MTKRIGVLIEVQDDDKYVLESFDSYEKAEEAKAQCINDYGHEYEIEECDFTEESSRQVDFVVDGNDMTILQSFTTPIKTNKTYKTIGKTGYIMDIVITDFEDECIFDGEMEGDE